MIINRHFLHRLLAVHKLPASHVPNFLNSFFFQKSKLRQLIEKLRIDLDVHKEEKYARFYSDLNEDEMNELTNGLKEFINSNLISNMQFPDNQLLHELMCSSLLTRELDQDGKDNYCQLIDLYFQKLQAELSSANDNFKDENISSIAIWLRHVIEFPMLYIRHVLVGGHANEYIFNSLNLEECGCTHMRHDRLIGDMRRDIEAKIIEQCQLLTRENKNAPIKLLSMGPGKGLQEFILIMKLFSLGISNIELILIEPAYEEMLNPSTKTVKYSDANWTPDAPLPEKYLESNQSSIYSIIRALSLLSKCFTEANLQVYQYDSVGAYKSDQARINKVDIIYAIDFEDYEPKSKAYMDFHALQDCLEEQGLAVLSYLNSITEFKVDASTNAFIEESKRVYPEIKMTEVGYQSKYPMSSFMK